MHYDTSFHSVTLLIIMLHWPVQAVQVGYICGHAECCGTAKAYQA